MNYEHDCGAEILACHVSIGTDGEGAGTLHRLSFRTVDFVEIHRCPGCAAELARAWEAGSLRLLEQEDCA